MDTRASPEARKAMPQGTSSPLATSLRIWGSIGVSVGSGSGLLDVAVGVDALSSVSPQPAIRPAPKADVINTNLRRSMIRSCPVDHFYANSLIVRIRTRYSDSMVALMSRPKD